MPLDLRARARPAVAFVRGHLDRLSDADPVDLGLRLALIALLLSGTLISSPYHFWGGKWLRFIAVAGIVVPGLLRSPLLWGTLLLIYLEKTWKLWFTQDNHHYLFLYWLLTVTLATALLKDPREAIAHSARWLLGIAFFYATLWKLLLSPDFMNGTYFLHTFLNDGRFRELGLLVGGMTEGMYRENALIMQKLQVGTEPAFVEVRYSASLLMLAKIVAWWTVIIEGAIALLFLWPENKKLSRYRHIPLLIFGMTTYTVAVVEPFGWTLMAIGVAQSGSAPRFVRLLYVCTWLLIFMYTFVPVLPTIRSFTGPLVSSW